MSDILRSSQPCAQAILPIQRGPAGTVRAFVLWAALFLGMAILSACTPAPALPYVDLTQRSPLPAAAAAEILPIRLAVAAIISPQGTAESYTDLARYIGEKLDRPVELVQRRTYAEVNDLVAQGEVDVAFVCTSAYVVGKESAQMELVAAPQIDGQSVYYSELIVPAASTAQSMADLSGTVFAFTDPMSFSGRVYPTYLVRLLGETPDHFFSRTFFTYSHDKAIEAVATGVAAGAAVDSLVLDYALSRDPGLAKRIRVIHRSPAFGIPPVVMPAKLPTRQKAQLRDILLSMDHDEQGRAILGGLGIDRFVQADDHAYDDIRDLVSQIGEQP